MIDNQNPEKDNFGLFRLLKNNKGFADNEGVAEETGETKNEDTPEVQEDPNINVDAGEETVEDKAPATEDWLSTLDDDLKNNPSITKFKDPKSLAKSYVELQKMIGKEKVVIPKEDAPQEEWDAFYAKMGRPEDINGYEAPDLGEDVPAEIKMKDEHLEQFRQKAHELGLTKKQFEELYGLQAQINQNTWNQQLEEMQQMTQKTETDLRQEWGATYDKKVDGAQKVINTFFKGKDMHPAFKTLASDKGFVRAMTEISEKMGEDVIAGQPRTTMTPKEAQSEYNNMLADPKHPLNDDLHPEHDAAVQRSIDLQSMIQAGE